MKNRLVGFEVGGLPRGMLSVEGCDWSVTFAMVFPVDLAAAVGLPVVLDSPAMAELRENEAKGDNFWQLSSSRWRVATACTCRDGRGARS